MKFSLIVATIGKKSELREMLLTIISQKYDLNDLEIIIVDQNELGFLNEILSEFNMLNIVYIHSFQKGLSLNRNIGLKKAKGDIICFPDDDCKFYDNTLIEVIHTMNKNNNVNFCSGQIYDRVNKKDIIRKWPKKKFIINKLNSYFINSSITLFVKKEYILKFDEKLGVGAKFGSCEDADLIYRIIKNGAYGVYTPKIQLWHPDPDYQKISLEKVKNYASGFGYFVKKETDLIKILLIILLIIKKCFQFFVNIFYHKFQNDYFKYFFSGLIIGLKGESNGKN